MLFCKHWVLGLWQVIIILIEVRQTFAEQSPQQNNDRAKRVIVHEARYYGNGVILSINFITSKQPLLNLIKFGHL